MIRSQTPARNWCRFIELPKHQAALEGASAPRPKRSGAAAKRWVEVEAGLQQSAGPRSALFVFVLGQSLIGGFRESRFSSQTLRFS